MNNLKENLIFGVIVIAFTLVAFADSDSPYKHEKVREIKALSEQALLTKHQIQLYDQLRGYETSHSDGHNHFH